jgi:hypothetical protein
VGALFDGNYQRSEYQYDLLDAMSGAVGMGGNVLLAFGTQ